MTNKKTKTPQPKTPETNQERDNFFTPRYATELLIPFLKSFKTIWECASGSGRMSNILIEHGFNVISTDISDGNLIHNYLNDDHKKYSTKTDITITNVPFSLKFDFVEKAFGINKPFAFLIPAEMSTYLWDCFRNRGLQAIVPERRIDYLTPNMLERINLGQGVEMVNKKFNHFEKKLKLKDILALTGKTALDKKVKLCFKENVGNFKSLEEVPTPTLRKYSSSDFHSFWVVYKFGLKECFNFTPLSLADKQRIL